MSGRFRRAAGGGVTARFGTTETVVLRQLLGELVELVAPDDEGSTDPLERAVGIGWSSSPPEDPALARLLPDAYADPEAAAEFRRYTEVPLREGKARNARTALESLDAPGRLHLDAEQAAAWLGALNDLRLTLAARLGLDPGGPVPGAGGSGAALEPDELPEDDPRRPAYAVYQWLGWLQETLVRALS